MSAPFTGTSASLRASGIARYFGAVLLIVWLAGWIVGEALAIVFLLALVRSVIGSVVGLPWPVPGGEWIAGGAAGFSFLFLIVWIALWTVGGLAAATELLRSLAGEDRVAVQGAEVELVRRAGPFRRVRRFDRSRVRRVRVRLHDKAVVMDTASGTEVVTVYGTPALRRELAEWLRRLLALPDGLPRVDPIAAPPGWVLSMQGSVTSLSQMDRQTRLTGSIVSWAIAVFTGLIWYGSVMAGSAWSSVIALAFTLSLIWWAAWVTWAHREWRVRQGELTRHKRFWAWESSRAFTNARLEVTVSTDSDSDDRYELRVVDARGRKTITSELNDHAAVVELARWLAMRTGFPLSLPSSIEVAERRH